MRCTDPFLETLDPVTVQVIYVCMYSITCVYVYAHTVHCTCTYIMYIHMYVHNCKFVSTASSIV